MNEFCWIILLLSIFYICYHLNTTNKRNLKSNIKQTSLQKTHSKKVRFNNSIKILYFHK